MKVGNGFTSTVTNERFRANVDATRKSSNVVYLIQCVKCKKQYVREKEIHYIYEWTATAPIIIGSSQISPLRPNSKPWVTYLKI